MKKQELKELIKECLNENDIQESSRNDNAQAYLEEARRHLEPLPGLFRVLRLHYGFGQEWIDQINDILDKVKDAQTRKFHE